MSPPSYGAGRVGDQRGQSGVLSIGFLLVALLLVAVVVDASAAYLRRQGLDNLADGAALAAADGIRERQVYTGRLGEQAALDPALARRLAGEHLRAAGAASTYPGVRWQVAAGPERVVVRVQAPLDLPIAVPGVDQSTLVSATAASVTLVSE